MPKWCISVNMTSTTCFLCKHFAFLIWCWAGKILISFSKLPEKYTNVKKLQSQQKDNRPGLKGPACWCQQARANQQALLSSFKVPLVKQNIFKKWLWDEVGSRHSRNVRRLISLCFSLQWKGGCHASEVSFQCRYTSWQGYTGPINSNVLKLTITWRKHSTGYSWDTGHFWNTGHSCDTGHYWDIGYS